MTRYKEYSTEAHQVQTEDGYLLSLLRIPEPKLKLSNINIDSESTNSSDSDPDHHPVPVMVKEEPGEGCLSQDDLKSENEISKTNLKPNNSSRPPVLLMHGLFSEGTHWLLNSEEKTLPHILAAQNYDVWLGSYRGSGLSKTHISISRKAKKFWDFDGNDISFHDIPAFIDYILKFTGFDSLYYCGHSFGNSVLFAALSLKPEYNAKIKLAAVMCPAVYGKHVRKLCVLMGGPIGTLVGKSKFLYRKKLGGMTAYKHVGLVCHPFRKKLAIGILKAGGAMIGYLNSSNFEKSRLDELTKAMPSSTSVKLLCHIMQCFRSGTFREYDYGRTENMKRYGQPFPPEYDLKKVTIKVATFTSPYDFLIPSQDVAQLAKELPNLIGHFETCTPKMSHVEFVVGHEKSTIVYDQIVKLFNDERNNV